MGAFSKTRLVSEKAFEKAS